VLIRFDPFLDSKQSIRTCFDLICGTSTGGLIAFALATTNLTLREIETLYKDLPEKIFTGWPWLNSARVAIGSFFGDPSKYSTADLEKFLHARFGDSKLKDFENQVGVN
jgi:patatin-like phospholipase/acyl hydrolase